MPPEWILLWQMRSADRQFWSAWHTSGNIRDMLWTVYNKRSQVKRLVSISEGVTELVLREY